MKQLGRWEPWITGMSCCVGIGIATEEFYILLGQFGLNLFRYIQTKGHTYPCALSTLSIKYMGNRPPMQLDSSYALCDPNQKSWITKASRPNYSPPAQSSCTFSDQHWGSNSQAVGPPRWPASSSFSFAPVAPSCGIMAGGKGWPSGTSFRPLNC